MKKSPSTVTHMTWPILIETALQVIMLNIEQLMLTRYAEEAVASVSNALQVLNFLILFFAVVGIATTIFLTRYIAVGNQKTVHILYSLALFCNTVVGLVAAAVLLLFSRQIFGLLSLPDAYLQSAELYVRSIGIFLFLQALIVSFTAIFRANAMMKVTMLVTGTVYAIKILCDLILINGLGPIPAMGVAGAAIGMNVSRLIGVILYFYLFKKLLMAKFSFRHLRPFPFSLLFGILKIGVPAGGENISYNFSQLVLQFFINTFGFYAIAVKGYMSILAYFSYLFTMSLSQATQIVIGYKIAENKLQEAKKEAWKYSFLAQGSSVLMATLMWLMSDFVVGIFTKDPAILSLIKTVMFVDIFLEFGRAVNMSLVRYLQVAGDVRFTVDVAIISMWVVSVGLGFVLGVYFEMGLVGIWTAMAIDECIRAAFYSYRWQKEKWHTKLLSKKEEE